MVGVAIVFILAGLALGPRLGLFGLAAGCAVAALVGGLAIDAGILWRLLTALGMSLVFQMSAIAGMLLHHLGGAVAPARQGAGGQVSDGTSLHTEADGPAPHPAGVPR